MISNVLKWTKLRSNTDHFHLLIKGALKSLLLLLNLLLWNWDATIDHFLLIQSFSVMFTGPPPSNVTCQICIRATNPLTNEFTV